MELFKKYEVNQIKYGCSFIFGDKDNIIKNTEKENKQMTREEVIKYAKEQLDVFGGKHAEFLESVIELLKEKPIPRNKEVRLIDANKLYEYIDDIKYTCDKYAEVKNILEIIDNQPTVKVTTIPDNATNGDVIKAMFPNIKYYASCVEVKLEYHGQYDTGLLFDKDWWNKKYKKEGIKNDKF